MALALSVDGSFAGVLYHDTRTCVLFNINSRANIRLTNSTFPEHVGFNNNYGFPFIFHRAYTIIRVLGQQKAI